MAAKTEVALLQTRSIMDARLVLPNPIPRSGLLLAMSKSNRTVCRGHTCSLSLFNRRQGEPVSSPDALAIARKQAAAVEMNLEPKCANSTASTHPRCLLWDDQSGNIVAPARESFNLLENTASRWEIGPSKSFGWIANVSRSLYAQMLYLDACSIGGAKTIAGVSRCENPCDVREPFLVIRQQSLSSPLESRKLSIATPISLQISPSRRAIHRRTWCSPRSNSSQCIRVLAPRHQSTRRRRSSRAFPA